MKNVLVIAPYAYLPWQTGGQKLIAQFLEYLGEKVSLHVISVQKNDAGLVRHYSLHPLLSNKASRYYDTSLTVKIAALVKEKNIQTIIWEHPYYAWLAFRVRKRTGVKTIIQTHNIEYQRFRSLGKWWWPILKMYERWSFKKADALFFITPEDRTFATTEWRIDPAKCIDIPFGVPVTANPTDKNECRQRIGKQHGIAPHEKILLFNGALDYMPNQDALQTILQHINPLLQKAGMAYKIIICGRGLPAAMNELKDYQSQGILYAGFVNEIEPYFKAADIMLNPVQTGGGIKTKMVEAIAYGTMVVSTQSGAAGMNRDVCGDKLVVIPDNDWNAFATAILSHWQDSTRTPSAYYDTYYWGAIVEKAASVC
ncbi:MAG: glycosyltransferase family 4 protein [Bacteroidetes bacterium]|nr:glycosyltransferase family 4 protein [Bacteroidota bacterium]